MNTIDIIIGLILIFGTVKGFLRGLFIEVTTLVGLVLGIYGAIHFSYFLGDFLFGVNPNEFPVWAAPK